MICVRCPGGDDIFDPTPTPVGPLCDRCLRRRERSLRGWKTRRARKAQLGLFARRAA